MKINNITIENFGIYKGHNHYDLSTNKNQNIILISGKNGAGKTTLLNAMKLCLYGPKLLGYKTENNPQYKKFISKKLNAYALEEKAENYSIHLDFELEENGHQNKYKLKRYWDLNLDNPVKNRELVSIHKNDTLLSPNQTEQYLTHISQTMPLNLFELFLFDGEKVGNMFLLKEDLTSMLDNIFKLDLFNDLSSDLKKYMRQKKKSSELSSFQKEKLSLQDDLEELSDQKELLKGKIQRLIDKKIEFKDQYDELQKYFSSIGGLNENALAEQRDIIRDLSLQKEHLANEYKSITNELLPFLMFKEELAEINYQINSEIKNKENNIIHNRLDQDDLKNHLKKSSNMHPRKIVELLSEIKSFFPCGGKDLVYDYSSAEIQEFQKFKEEIFTIDESRLSELYNEIESLNSEILKLRKQVEENQSEEFKKTSLSLEEISNKISKTDEKRHDSELDLNEIESQMNFKQNELKKVEQELISSEKEANLDNVVSKCQTVLERYTREITSLKRAQLEQHIASIFTQLIRKEDFIQSIKVDDQTGKIKLINKLGAELPKENLSAGEKQLYILSILYGMIKVSEKKVPLVFDTLLGRLDKTHKSNIVKHFLSTAGDQVIILATDSEIDDEYKALLQNHINQYYCLEFDNTKNKVLINKPKWEDSNAL